MDWIAVGGIVAALLALALLGVSQLRARREAARFRVLDAIARASDSASDLDETLEAIVGILVPAVADIVAIDMIRDGQPRRAATRVSPRAGGEIGERIARRRPSTPASMLAPGAGAALEPRFIERFGDGDLRQLAHDEEDLELLRGLGLRSSITAALRARGRVIGAVTLTTAWSRRRYHRHDAEFARVLSGRIALALDNAGLFADLERVQREREEIATTLQHGLLPPPLPRIPGWSAAAMYQPAGAENEVGGDFYDAFPITGGWMLVIGDVTGKGAAAASITAQARYTLRAAAWLSGDPLVAFGTLNSALLARPDSALCSVIAFTLSSNSREPVRVAVAGHLPPLLVDGEGVSEIAEGGPVLGAFGDASWELAQASVRPGQQLIAVTDGVTEACGPGGRFGEHRLRAELGGAGEPNVLVTRLEQALNNFTDGRLEDDAAALAIAPSARLTLAA
ncbi:MAG: GAF domain-containing SpoIIE family protein phosphatase [Solirubrobacterales bacterium]